MFTYTQPGTRRGSQTDEKEGHTIKAKFRYRDIPASEREGVEERLRRLNNGAYFYEHERLVFLTRRFYVQFGSNDHWEKTLYLTPRLHGFNLKVWTEKPLTPEEMLNLRELDDFVRTGKVN